MPGVIFIILWPFWGICLFFYSFSISFLFSCDSISKAGFPFGILPEDYKLFLMNYKMHPIYEHIEKTILRISLF